MKLLSRILIFNAILIATQGGGSAMLWGCLPAWGGEATVVRIDEKTVGAKNKPNVKENMFQRNKRFDTGAKVEWFSSF